MKSAREQTVEIIDQFYNSTFDLKSIQNSWIKQNNINHDSFIERINTDDIRLLPIKNSDYFYNVESGGARLIKHKLLNDGYFSFQDRAGGAIVEVLDPQLNEIILDVCCTPATKANYISELIENSGIIYTGDVEKNRINNVKKDGKRLKNKNVYWEQKGALKTFPFVNKMDGMFAVKMIREK